MSKVCCWEFILLSRDQASDINMCYYAFLGIIHMAC